MTAYTTLMLALHGLKPSNDLYTQGHE